MGLHAHSHREPHPLPRTFGCASPRPGLALSRRQAMYLATLAVSHAPHTASLHVGTAPAAAASLTDEQALLVEAWAVVQRGYVDPQFGGLDWKGVKAEFLKRKYKDMREARAAASEMISLLGDRYTRYLTPGAYESLLSKYEQPADTGGIGVTVRSLPQGAVEIVSVAKDGAAAAAGLRVGDVFESIDQTADLSSASADEVAGMLLGSLREPVRVGVRRADGSRASFSLTRRVMKQGEVETRLVEAADGRRVGVLRVPVFSAPVGGGGGGGTLDSIISALGSERLKSAQELIIDLRGNVGGHFPSGVEAAKLFLPADAIVVSTVDRTGRPSPVVTFEPGRFSDLRRPTYVLVDKGTASAAEVFAGALQENRCAIVVGEQTYGKGLVQSIQKLTDGSAVVLTVAKYRTPRGIDINGRGITPNLPIRCDTEADAAVCLQASLQSS
ncbi:hypothetical protein AB1Y20_007221 [Prymnesium parvum]|uniref:PDZ domain-containing protein n=1 Tax=Prymnesium parvum TaxID=97485 RepID=A0AB34IUN0_PRYPA